MHPTSMNFSAAAEVWESVATYRSAGTCSIRGGWKTRATPCCRMCDTQGERPPVWIGRLARAGGPRSRGSRPRSGNPYLLGSWFLPPWSSAQLWTGMMAADPAGGANYGSSGGDHLIGCLLPHRPKRHAAPHRCRSCRRQRSGSQSRSAPVHPRMRLLLFLSSCLPSATGHGKR
jgi:hypothetical protein